MQCGRCGRKLKDPESISIGYGPICRDVMGIRDKKKIRKASNPKNHASSEQETEIDIPGQMSFMDNPNFLPDTMRGENL